MKTLDFAIGKKLPLDVLMQPVFLGAGRGWGKTSTAKALYEAAHDAGAQCITIAPTGKWWSLRLDADGKPGGLKDVIIFGGPHGDVPLTAEAGDTIARVLVGKRLHAVLDVSLLRKGERARFLAAFMEEFWLLKKLENESYPVVLFVEEAHAVAPQRPQPEEARMLGAAEDIATEGRNHGIGIVFLDQRAARVNKNVLALVEVLVVGRTLHPLDLKANGDWVIDKGADDRSWLKELPRLEPGEAYVYAPVLDIFERLRIRMPRTFNATATARIGERMVKAGSLSAVDVSALRESMAQVIAEAEKDDPKALKREIGRLKAELAKKPTAAPVKTVEVKEVRTSVPVLGRDVADRLLKLQVAISAALTRFPSEIGNARPAPAPQPPKILQYRPQAVEVPAAKFREVPRDGAKSSLGKGERAVLTAVAQHDAGVTREQLTVLTRYKRSSRDSYLQRLSALGCISFRGETITATPEGMSALGTDFEPLPTGDELRKHWLARLPQGERAVLEVVLKAFPDSVPRDSISDATGYKRSSRDSYLQRLSARRLVDEPQRGEIRASSELFSSEAA